MLSSLSQWAFMAWASLNRRRSDSTSDAWLMTGRRPATGCLEGTGATLVLVLKGRSGSWLSSRQRQCLSLRATPSLVVEDALGRASSRH